MVKKKSVKKSPARVKRDLEIFEKGVERLKELEGELNSLDSRGFAKEEQAIRGKLKNVSDVPTIEVEIKALKLKINRKYRPKKRKGKSKVVKQLEEMNKKIDLMKRAPRKDIDSGVGILVDTDFNNFLGDVKAKLSERVKGKERELDEVLKSDLVKRELNFKGKFEGLIREFNVKKKKLAESYEKRYRVRLNSDLHREVSDRFDKELKGKLDSKKVVLGKKFKESVRSHAHKHLAKRELALKRELARKLSGEIVSLERGFERKRKKLEEGMSRKYNSNMFLLGRKKRAIDVDRKRFEDRKAVRLGKERAGVEAEKRKLRNVEKKRMNVLEVKIRKHVADNKGKRDKLVKKEKELEMAKRDLVNEKVGLERETREEIKRLKKGDEIKKKLLGVKLKKGAANNKRKRDKLERGGDKLERMRKNLKDARDKLEGEKKKLEREAGVKMEGLMKGIDKRRAVLEGRINAKRKMIESREGEHAVENKNSRDLLERKRGELENAKRDFGRKKIDEIQKIKDNLSERFHKDLNVELGRKEKEMRSELKNEYGLLLKKKIDEHEAELKKRKIDLELEIQRKMREALS